MKLINRFGRKLAFVFAVIGVLLILTSLFFSKQPISADIWLDGGDDPVQVPIRDSYAANWLLEAGIRLYPNDNVFYQGKSIPYDLTLPKKNGQQLVYKPAVPIQLLTTGEELLIYSGARTLGEALWESNIFLKKSDFLSLPMNTRLNQAIIVELNRSQPIHILYRDQEINSSVSSVTVGGALAEVNISLQSLDYSIPEADQPIPLDRTINIVRVREEILTEDMIIPFNTERVSDPEMNVGEEQVLRNGENGIQTTTVRVRYEDEEETERITLTEWVSKAPVAERISYGGNVVVQTFDSSDGSVDYWMKKEVHITSYLDTGSKTASGIWPYYGVIAVSPEWYSILKGTSIYVPGYGVGTVLDVCPGCVGKPWIDVFIPTDQYVAWSRTETVYFLPPAPENFSGELP